MTQPQNQATFNEADDLSRARDLCNAAAREAMRNPESGVPAVVFFDLARAVAHLIVSQQQTREAIERLAAPPLAVEPEAAAAPLAIEPEASIAP